MIKRTWKNSECLLKVKGGSLSPRYVFVRNFSFFIFLLGALIQPGTVFGVEGCPKKDPKLKPISCKDDEDTDCQECHRVNREQQEQVEKFKGAKGTCEATAARCAQLLSREPTPGLGQKARMSEHKKFSEEANQCKKDNAAEAGKAKDAAKKCSEGIKKACGKVKDKGAKSAADKNADSCKKAADDAEEEEKKNKEQEEKADENAQKDGDNAKKEESPGGGAPPGGAPPQGGDKKPETPREVAQYPAKFDTDTNTATEKVEDPEIESVKLDDEKEKRGVAFVGDANSNKPTVTSGGHSFAPGGNASMAAQKEEGKGGKIDSALGAVAATGAVGSSGGGPTGSSNSPGNSSGASQMGDLAKDKGADANPFEVPPGGGRLSVPKGKGNGDNDAPVDAKAADAFQKDFVKPGGDGKREIASMPGDNPEDGYSIFKMVKYRYAELKKKGNI